MAVTHIDSGSLEQRLLQHFDAHNPIPILPRKRPSPRRIKAFAQDHTNKKQSQDLSSGLSASRTHALNPDRAVPVS